MNKASSIRSRYGSAIKGAEKIKVSGRLSKVIGMVLESDGPKAAIGEICEIKDYNGITVCRSEIVGFKDNNRILSMVLGDLENIRPGMEVVSTGRSLSIPVGKMMLGRVLDGLGNPIDGLGSFRPEEIRSVYAKPPNPLHRQRITQPIPTGIKAIDGMNTLGKGQRMGIFAGSGVGKSTLLGMIAKNTDADINVIALIGERGREVKEFIDKELGEEGLKRSVIIVATSDAPPLVKVKAALTATTIAEYFRDGGLDVMLMMDSATRLAMAQREVGLTIGEPPTAKGYTPSVWTLFQKVMERAGNSATGSITGLYTVLVEGDDFNEPVTDNARGILDGHLMLSRKLASRGHYPAIDVLDSISRVMGDITTPEHKVAAKNAKEVLAAYRESEDLISVGAYQKGTNRVTDIAIALEPSIKQFLIQDVYDTSNYETTVQELDNISASAMQMASQ
jgi:flagellum-specific ATP synthase